MRRSSITHVLALLVSAVLLSSCAGGAADEAEAPEPEAASADRAVQVAALGDVDTACAPAGVTVDQVITTAEACDILGREDVFVAVAAG